MRFHIHLWRDVDCLFLGDFLFITVLVKTNWLGKFKYQVCITCVCHYLGMVVANYLCHYFILYMPYHLCHYFHMDEANTDGHISAFSSIVTLLFGVSDEFEIWLYLFYWQILIYSEFILPFHGQTSNQNQNYAGIY